MLTIEGLTKSYGRLRALNGLNMHVKKHDLYGFIGPNGAGKTTTIRIMAGLLKADSGKVVIDGMEVGKDLKILKEKIGYVPDFFGVYENLKAIEYMEFYASLYGLVGKAVKNHCFELMELVGLLDKADQYVDDLSRGMQQRLCLARALVHSPKLLILDEPASGLDPRSRMEFKEILKELSVGGTTILISSHILSELSEMCTSIGIIQKGEMVLQGKIEEIVSRINTVNPLIIKVLNKEDTAIALLYDHPLVKTLSISGKELQITFEGSGEQESELLKELLEEGVHVISFARKKDNLETIYMNLTN